MIPRAEWGAAPPAGWRRFAARAGKPNPRFVVTSLAIEDFEAPTLSCARGDMENPSEEQQLALFADRTGTATLRANRLRLWFSSMAYVRIAEPRRRELRDSALARAQAGTIRLRSFETAAIARVRALRIAISLHPADPLQTLFRQIGS